MHEAFQRALERRDTAAIRELVAKDPAARAMIDAPLFPFDTPPIVHFAAAGDLGLVDLLLELGADPNRRSDWWAGGFHALHYARGAVAERLLEAGSEPDACAAAQLDRADLLRRILDEDAERVHERGGDGQTPLHFARSVEVVDLLLARGADPDARCVDHRSTPAQWMLQQRRGRGRYDVAAYLVQRGATADVFLAAALGLTGRLAFILEADPTSARLRTGHGPYGEKKPSSFHIYTWTIGQNLSPLEVAAQFDQEGAYRILETHATPSERLLAACAHGRVHDAREIAAEHPGLIESLTATESRALPAAGWIGNAEAVDLMLSLGFDANARGESGETVLHAAAWQGAVACVATALSHEGVRATLETEDGTYGSTPLGWCCHGSRHCRNALGDHAAAARLLLEAGARPGPNLRDATEAVLAVIRETS